MNAKKLTLVFIFLLFILASKTALAQEPWLRIPGGAIFPLPPGFVTIGDVISKLLPYIFVLAGLILFGFLIFGGFELLTSAGNPEKVKLAQGKITSAVIGFVIIFVAYWLVQILEVIFGLKIF